MMEFLGYLSRFSGLRFLDTPDRRLLHYAVFVHFSNLPSVHYKESA